MVLESLRNDQNCLFFFHFVGTIYIRNSLSCGSPNSFQVEAAGASWCIHIQHFFSVDNIHEWYGIMQTWMGGFGWFFKKRRNERKYQKVIMILLMAEILHQLRLVFFPIIYRVSAPSQVVLWDFSHQQEVIYFDIPMMLTYYSVVSHLDRITTPRHQPPICPQVESI